MNGKVETLILEQLRLIRDDMAKIQSRIYGGFSELSGRLEAVETDMQSVQGILFSLGGYIRGLDQHVGHIEAEFGIEEV